MAVKKPRQEAPLEAAVPPKAEEPHSVTETVTGPLGDTLPPAPDLFEDTPAGGSSVTDSGVEVTSLGRVATSLICAFFDLIAGAAKYEGFKVDSDERELWDKFLSLALKEMDKKVKAIYMVGAMLAMKQIAKLAGYVSWRKEHNLGPLFKKKELADKPAKPEAPKPPPNASPDGRVPLSFTPRGGR